ncbi:MAG TPA: carbamoyltransferase HypF [Vicinamibacteria bacterium]|nr:carbamoyltransferase HypF [Vicinamibacteria bacterium]
MATALESGPLVAGRRIEVRGIVQGVGFRPWVYRLAHEEGIRGRVRNDGAGVTIEAFGSPSALSRFVKRIGEEAPPAARVLELRERGIGVEPVPDFAIAGSRDDGARRVSIPPELATCPDCLAEVFDPADRRYLYPFTNCTNCGPRYTIARDTPYDRPATTMAAFSMCAECRREYDDPLDRRFHAQPNACPACGPRVRLLDRLGNTAPGDPIPEAARALRDGRIVAVKGLGGYHLACDATSSDAVLCLRERKQRDEKPFAVMVRGLDEARALARILPAEESLLTSVARPIVLVRQWQESGLAPELAPGNPLVGLMLAYTPLHHLLLAEAGRPLVMTSGNLSDEPMAAADAEALERLSGIADLFLAHDREIENRCDDSVARVIADSPTILRRSRGYVPRPVALARPLRRPVLACGAQLKNTFCLAAGREAWLGPHIGDLDNLEATRAFEEQVERLQRFLGIRPEVIAHDLHPDYASTRYAQKRPESLRIAVQHHHAHVASAMAEHGLEGPVLGLAWDGTGYGTDGTAWGGELLRVTPGSCERLATLRPLRLAGGDEAIRQVWRIALAVLDDAFDGRPPLERLHLFDALPTRDVSVVRRMLQTGLRSPLAHGAGRYFDALGAIGLGRARASYEGQVALEWNLAAADGAVRAYPFELGVANGLVEADLRPLVRAAVTDVVDGVTPARVSAAFHEALCDVAAAQVRGAAAHCGRLPVVLSGGCFQNARLAEGVRCRLAGDFCVFMHGEVPPGDGGIALGQALVADAVVEDRGGL